jgi:periplasmic divalent cation tolerance protein
LSEPSSHRLVYVTTADRAEALRIGRAVVERRLAACVNVIDPMRSIYWWQGTVESAEEAVLIAKTSAARLPALIEAVRSLHGYSCPCVVALPIVEGNPDFLAWIDREVATEPATD